jgi:CheY-like chemotaxis protein
VSGDAARLQQIVWNLLSNAVKFTPTGGQVEVQLERIGNQAQIQVKDTGKGIKPEFLPHVFEYFRQEDGTTTRQFGGLGLGLAIVRHLSELHGGIVGVDSSGEGLGATFTVSFPLLTIASKLPLDIKSNTNSISLSGVRILVVDDDADMRDFAKFLLEQYEAQVKAVTSALEALDVFDRFKPDVLISDIGMPAMDGYMLMRQVRSRSPELGGQIPAIALTAYAGEFDQQQALAVGFQQHLAKPVEPEELVKAIVKLIR